MGLSILILISNQMESYVQLERIRENVQNAFDNDWDKVITSPDSIGINYKNILHAIPLSLCDVCGLVVIWLRFSHLAW